MPQITYREINMLKRLMVTSLFLIITASVNAKTVWSNYSISYLLGDSYEVGDSSREVITFEYTAGTTWGDTFMFFDRLESSDGSVETYGEFAPRYKIKDLDGFIKSVYIAPAIEMGPGTNYLLGVGTDLAVPNFNFFQLNAYIRDNADGDMSFQTTVVWGLPIGPLTYGGFIDFATGVDNTVFGDTQAQLNFTSQLKYDIAEYLGSDTKVFIGVEYVFWNNKFGIDGVDERNMNLLMQYHF